MKHVIVTVKIIVRGKKIIVGILVHAFVKKVSIYKLSLMIQKLCMIKFYMLWILYQQLCQILYQQLCQQILMVKK